jgi:hypothetical protein
VQIKDIETELDVVQAGSHVVAEEFERLTAEKEDLMDSITGKVIEEDEEDGKELENIGFILDS